MGEVAVLHPQDVLNGRVSRANLSFSPMTVPPRTSKPKPNPDSNTNPSSSRSNRRKRSPPRLPKKKGDSPAPVAESQAAKGSKPVMGQVKILKRGEVLGVVPKGGKLMDEMKENRPIVEDMTFSSTDRLGPEPNMVPKQVALTDFYAGTAFISSPPPSSVPLPGFFKNKSILTENSDAANDLRRILGLDLA